MPQLPPVIVSVIVLLGFSGFSFLAMKPELTNVKESVVLFLLGAWSTMAAGVVNYWVGSSAGSAKKDEASAKKDEVIQSMAATATGTGNGIKP